MAANWIYCLEEADTKIAYCCSSFREPCIVKAKDTNTLILMSYAYVVQQSEHYWYMQTDKYIFVSIRKIYGKFDSNTCLLLP